MVNTLNVLEISSMGIYPPRSGGSLRIHSLSVEVSKYQRVFLFALGIRKFEMGLKTRTARINQNYQEYRYINFPYVVMSYLMDRMNLPPLYAGRLLSIFTPSMLKEELRTCNVIQVECPWLFETIYRLKPPGTPIILSEHNVEWKLFKMRVREGSAIDKKASRLIERIERNAVEKAVAIVVVSGDDKEELVRSYGKDPSMVYVIPNGVYASKAPAISDVEKQMAKMELGLKGMKIALFAGWAYPPNYQAVEEILKISEKVGREDVMIIVAGRAGEPFMRRGAGKNIRFTGYVDDLSIYFKAADIALNPMVSGGGTNIKMLDYFIWGLPVITTQVGARGLDIKDGEHAMVSGLEDFPQQIVRLLDDEGLRQELSNNCRRLVAEKYDWSAIARELVALYEMLAKKE